MVNNRARLSAFLRHPGMPLENNEVEQTLRVPVRLRNNSRCFHAEVGSAIADTLWIVGATALPEGVNLLGYFTAGQRHASDIRARPELWVPWSYHEHLDALDATRPRAALRRSMNLLQRCPSDP